MFTKNANKQGKVISDPVSYKDLHANRRSNQISNKTIGTSLFKYVYEDSPVSTKNRFTALMDENDCISDTDNCELHSELGEGGQHVTQCKYIELG